MKTWTKFIHILVSLSLASLMIGGCATGYDTITTGHAIKPGEIRALFAGGTLQVMKYAVEGLRLSEIWVSPGWNVILFAYPVEGEGMRTACITLSEDIKEAQMLYRMLNMGHAFSGEDYASIIRDFKSIGWTRITPQQLSERFPMLVETIKMATTSFAMIVTSSWYTFLFVAGLGNFPADPVYEYFHQNDTEL